ncbi:MAG: hypothetical protein WAK17_13265 [Candidatus Nitrosopolaris sp.]
MASRGAWENGLWCKVPDPPSWCYQGYHGGLGGQYWGVGWHPRDNTYGDNNGYGIDYKATMKAMAATMVR